MEAKALIDSAAFEPDALRTIGQAFEQAWDEIGHVFTSPEQKEAARLCLANGILARANNESRNVCRLRLAGHRALVLNFSHVLAGRYKPKQT